MNLGPRFSFTRFTLLLTALGFCQGPSSFAWATSTCLLAGVAISFSSVPMFDSTAYERMRIKYDWSMTVFHAGHILLHILPFCYTLYNPPLSLDMSHGISAVAIHATWGWFFSSGSFCMDKIYVPMKPKSWLYTWAIALSTELAVPQISPLSASFS